MKTFGRNILASFMALLILGSTVSVSMDMHYCGDHLVDFSLFDEAETCMMQMAKVNPSSPCDDVAPSMACCSDIEIVLEGQEHLKASWQQLSLDQQFFVVAFARSWAHLYREAAEKAVPYADYVPPPLIRDVQILDQTFLI
ncbi:HYC_CC_PP family protein [Maribacter sp. 2307ULW6-5]